MKACKCSETHAPFRHELSPGDNRRPRQWFVLRRNFSISAFNGYRRKWSDSSDVHCRVCGACWRTKAGYVSSLADCEFWPSSTPPAVAATEQEG